MTYHLSLEGYLHIAPALLKEDEQSFRRDYGLGTWVLEGDARLFPRATNSTVNPIHALGILLTEFLSPRGYRLSGKLNWVGEDGTTGEVHVVDNEVRVSSHQELEPGELGLSLLDSLQSGDPDRQILAMDLISQDYAFFEERERFLPHLIALSEHRSLDLRLAAVYTLANFREYAEQVMPHLTMALTDPVPWIRGIAAETLGEWGRLAQTALPALHDLKKDTDPMARRKAILAYDAISAGMPHALSG